MKTLQEQINNLCNLLQINFQESLQDSKELLKACQEGQTPIKYKDDSHQKKRHKMSKIYMKKLVKLYDLKKEKTGCDYVICPTEHIHEWFL